MNESAANPAESIPPVTILCGFLGAGKTTLLNHLLRQAEGRRWAAVVNDVAAINIDAAVVRATSGGGEIVELGNGCVCCSNRDDLAETIARLAAEGSYDHILVETTGVAEPRGVAVLFLRKNPFGRSLSDFARLSALVSVIDAAHFLAEWHKQRGPGATPVASGPRPVFELMVEQVECADVIVINKCDLLGGPELEQLEQIVRGLNERAEIVRAEQGQIASELLLERVRFDPVATLGAARWIRVLNTTAGSAAGAPALLRQSAAGARPAARHGERFGITSWVFQARRPFAQAKFDAFLAAGIPGLLRAKGYFWLAERPDELGFLSIAGGVVRQDFPNYWWATLVENGRVARDKVPPQIEKLWLEPHGERRQELVFIGVNMNIPALRQELNAMLK